MPWVNGATPARTDCLVEERAIGERWSLTASLDKEQSTTQAARRDELLAKHGSAKSLGKEAVAGAVATLAGFAHVAAKDDVLKNVLAAIGFKAYEIGSSKALIALAELAGATDDKAVLERSMAEEQEMGDWLGAHLPSLVAAYLAQRSA